MYNFNQKNETRKKSNSAKTNTFTDKNNEHQQMKRIAGPLAFDLMRPGGSLRKAKRFFFK